MGRLFPRPRYGVDRRRRPFNRIPKSVLDALAWWERPVLGKVLELHPPHACRRVADIGGGSGRVSIALRKLGYKVTLFEPGAPVILRHVFKNGRWRAIRRKARPLDLRGVRVRRRKFWVKDADDFDVLVAVRPHNASQRVVRAAKYRPLVMMPCTSWCAVWPGDSGAVRAIERCFLDLGVGFHRQGRDLFWTGESPQNPYV